MEKVFTGKNEMEAYFVRNMLAVSGIEAEIVGGALGAARGEIPYTEDSQPYVAVAEADLDKAREIIATFEKDGHRVEPKTADKDWTCPGCGERIEGQFGMCWKCMAKKPMS